MDNGGDILQLCRLCLVKDQVNIPIFEEQGDIRQIFLKISSCLPVKVTPDDKLPKKICDGCSCKLDMLYEFWNTTANAEKQLVSWLDQAGLKANTETADQTMSVVAQQVSSKPSETVVKEEAADEIFMEEITFSEKWEEASSSAGPSATITSDEPPPKRARRAAAVRASLNVAAESDDEDDLDTELTKIEDESEDEDDAEVDDPSYVDAPSTSADDQPGPSGVGKDGGDAPLFSVLEADQAIEDFLINIVESNHLPDGQTDEDMTLETIRIQCVEEDNPSIVPTNDESLCYVCGLIMKPEQLTNHLDEHFCDDNSICYICQIQFESENELVLHKELSHYEIISIYSCNICDINFEKPVTFALHNYRHVKAYQCPLCNFSTQGRNSFICHSKRHEGKFDYVCNICSRGFLSRAVLDEHMDMHAGINKHVCEFCDKKFTVKRYLEDHKKLNHKKELFGFSEIYQCEVCQRTFTFEKSLMRHRSSIHGIGKSRMVQCPVCQKVIANNYNLKIHMRIHTGEKQFVCHLCGKAFSEYKYYKKHNARHHDNVNDENSLEIRIIKSVAH